MPNSQDDLQSAREIRRMADLYVRRGAQGKAAELLDLAARIEARVNGQIQFARVTEFRATPEGDKSPAEAP